MWWRGGRVIQAIASKHRIVLHAPNQLFWVRSATRSTPRPIHVNSFTHKYQSCSACSTLMISTLNEGPILDSVLFEELCRSEDRYTWTRNNLCKRSLLNVATYRFTSGEKKPLDNCISTWKSVEHKARKCTSPVVIAHELCELLMALTGCNAELLMTLTGCNAQLAITSCDQWRSRRGNKKDYSWFREWTYLYHTAQNCRNRRCAHKCITISKLCIPEFMILTKQYCLVHPNKSQFSLHKIKS